MTWQLWTTCSSSSISSTDLSATSPRKLYWRSYWCDHCDNNMRSSGHCWITLTPRISAPLHHIFPAKAENLTANLATIHRDTCQHRSQTLKVSLVFVLQNCQFNPHQLLQSPADRSGSFDTDLFLWPDHTVFYMFEVYLHWLTLHLRYYAGLKLFKNWRNQHTCVFKDSVSEEDQDAIEEMMEKIEDNTCLRFRLVIQDDDEDDDDIDSSPTSEKQKGGGKKPW